MIVYQASKKEFLADVFSNDIDSIILKKFKEKLQRYTGKREQVSWKNSMEYMYKVLLDSEIPADSGVAIEYNIPQTSKRIDFILTGSDEFYHDHAVIVELKQWEEATITDKDGIVVTYVGGDEREVNHPSYQVWSYAELLKYFNQSVYDNGIDIIPCAYLHNYNQSDVLTNNHYAQYLQKAPLFLKHDAQKLQDFIKKYVKYGDSTKILYRIDNGIIKPSKSLAEDISALFEGNSNFVMIDDQKLIYERSVDLVKKHRSDQKEVFIIEGGPGTGKSVIAVNILVTLLKMQYLAKYISKNVAPRAVFEYYLTGNHRKSYVSDIFTGSGSFINSEQNLFDALIVDEAHRLNEKSGMMRNLGENQIKEIINAAKVSIFFLDEDQQVTLFDIGEKEEIEKWANFYNARIHTGSLESQFRCNGSDGYLAWLDNILQIRNTANESLDDINYDFQIICSPNELREIIYEKNKINNKARMVAGYCWDWISRGNKNEYDIVFPEYNFKAKWNLSSYGSLWIIDPNSVSEIGCIHTCQGLDIEYVGVIIGPDLVVRDKKVITDASKRSHMDSSIKGFRNQLTKDYDNGYKKIDRIIKNTYRTLMTRATKGCYVYCVDKETEEYFQSMINRLNQSL